MQSAVPLLNLCLSLMFTCLDKWMTELQTQFEREQEAFGATEEEMKMKIAEILSQLEAASKCSVEAHTTAETAAIVAVGESGATAPSAAAQYLDVTKIMDLNRECRKRIAQIGEIKGTGLIVTVAPCEMPRISKPGMF